MLVINSILHFIVDGICAFAMFGKYGSDGATAYLLYNLFAFALQMPVGALADLVSVVISKGSDVMRKRFYWVVTLLGILFVIIGMFAGPFALGVGNAMFHVGGGLIVIDEDRRSNFSGRGLGIFVAPGALGLFVGNLASDFKGFETYVRNIWIGLAILMVLIGFLRLYYEEKHLVFIQEESGRPAALKNPDLSDLIIPVVVCFAVVVLRSYVGLSINFSWKSGIIAGLAVTVAVVLGKAAGGFLAAWLGDLKAVCISLGIAAVCFLFSDIPVFGVLALFFFNMTMPITLYMLIKKLPKLPGFSFGLLTFALFVGFFMVYMNITVPLKPGITGCIGSLITLILLMIVILVFSKKTQNGEGKRS